uniref:Transmembrane protein n=1 Tax=Romanomermis culicivorax TaxID=13658 RepID=A0A915JVH7_ROMCU
MGSRPSVIDSQTFVLLLLLLPLLLFLMFIFISSAIAASPRVGTQGNDSFPVAGFLRELEYRHLSKFQCKDGYGQ